MKTVFFDIDGTLIDLLRGLKDPSEKTKYAFRELKKNARTVIASGRMLGMLPQGIVDLQADGYLMCNGSFLQLDGKTLFNYGLEEHYIQEIVDYCERHNSVYYVESAFRVYTNGIGHPVHEYFCELFEDDTQYTPYGECDPEEVINMLSVAFDSADTMEDFIKIFSKDLDVRYQFEGMAYVDVNIRGINKGIGIRRYCELTGTPKEDVYVFGDSFNDLEMMEEAGTGIAMGNAVEAVKNRADEVTEDVLEDGVYHALLRHGLIEPMEE